jgi:hypothetical protein
MNKLAETLSGGYVIRAGNEERGGGELLSDTETGKNSAQQIVRSKFARNLGE